MNRLTKWMLSAGIVLTLTITACSNASTPTQSPVPGIVPNTPTVQTSAGAPVLPPTQTTTNAATTTLTISEAAALAFMREEEKLARDVYTVLFAKWQLPTFQNIAQSEQTHMDSLKSLLDRYGVADPAAGKATGVFVNPELQKLYDQLVQQGSQSLADALRVGGLIEEVDIVDLQTRVAQTDKLDIKLVYDNLMRGSRNHLRSFVAQLKNQTSVPYAPQKLSLAEYIAIINGNTETGGNGKGNGNSNTNQGTGTTTQGNGFRGGRR